MYEEMTKLAPSDIEKEVKNHSIVLFNDNENTFEYVIWCLVNYCEHSPIQAEQCATIVHHKGKYAVKHGSIEELIAIDSALQDKGLTTEIQ
jgi:ATP-dependent Clp protease adaptor protein ClpS